MDEQDGRGEPFVGEAPPPPADGGTGAAHELPAGWIARYFRGTRSYSTPRFIIELALVPFPLKMMLGVTYAVLGGRTGESTTDALSEGGMAELLVAGLVLAPLIETFIGQWLPILFFSLFTKKIPMLVIGSSLVFASQHLYVGIPGLLIAFPVGIFLSWSFIEKRRRSRWTAYWVTTAIHSVHNALAIGIYLSAGG